MTLVVMEDKHNKEDSLFFVNHLQHFIQWRHQRKIINKGLDKFLLEESTSTYNLCLAYLSYLDEFELSSWLLLCYDTIPQTKLMSITKTEIADALSLSCYGVLLLKILWIKSNLEQQCSKLVFCLKRVKCKLQIQEWHNCMWPFL